MRKTYLLLFSISLFLIGCEKDELNTGTEDIGNSNKDEDVAEIINIHFNALPERIQLSLNNQKGQKDKSLSQLISNSTGKKYTDMYGWQC